VTRFGYYIPFAIGGNAISAVGAGLLSTLTVSSDAGKYVGYQILCGLGRGAIMQLPLIAVQTAVPASQVSIGVALITFNQFFSASIFITLTQTIFVNSLGPALKKFAPAVNTSSVINVGATSLREAVPANELTGVLMAYNEALMHTFVTPFLRGL
jgi:hypothetical protein